MKKKPLIPLIFLFSFFIILIFIPPALGATESEIISNNQVVLPVQGAWFYEERNDLIDFEEYIEGSSPNLTAGGYIQELDITGVYERESERFQDVLNKHDVPYSLLYNDDNYNFSYTHQEVTTGYNNSQAAYGGVTIWNNETITVNTSYYYQSEYNFIDETLETTPINWTELTGSVVIRQYIENHSNILAIDSTAAMSSTNHSWASQTDGRIEFYFRTTDNTQDFYLYLYEDYSGAAIDKQRYYHSGGQWQVNEGGGLHAFDTPTIALNNEWYHIRIELDTNGNSLFYINGTLFDTSVMWNPATDSTSDIWMRQGNAGGDGITYIDAFDINTASGYFYNRNLYLVNGAGLYWSHIIDLGREVLLTNVTANLYNGINSTCTAWVSSNATGYMFTTFYAYDYWINRTVRFVRLQVLIGQNYSMFAPYFNSVTFHYYNEMEIFRNNKDKLLWIHNVKNNTEMPSIYLYDYNMSNGIGFVQGQVELIFIHAIYPFSWTKDNGGTVGATFTVLLNGQQQFLFNLKQYFDASQNCYGNWSLWTGGNTYQEIELIPYHNHSSSNSDNETYYFMCYNVLIDYTYNSKVSLTVSEMIGYSECTELFTNTSSPVANGTDSYINYANLKFGNNQTKGEALLVAGIDSSRTCIDYQINQMFDNITKNCTAYNAELVHSFWLSTPNYMTEMSISSIEIMSEMNSSQFISFIASVKGNTAVNFDYTQIDSFTTISSNLYTSTLLTLIINAKYRCKNLNEFNNTIYIRITRIYTPYSPGFSDLLMTALPPLFTILIPSGVAYIKFKKMGFLAVFFLMTLICMGIGWVPLVPGLLILTLLVIIFLKILQNEQGGSNNAN